MEHKSILFTGSKAKTQYSNFVNNLPDDTLGNISCDESGNAYYEKFPNIKVNIYTNNSLLMYFDFADASNENPVTIADIEAKNESCAYLIKMSKNNGSQPLETTVSGKSVKVNVTENIGVGSPTILYGMKYIDKLTLNHLASKTEIIPYKTNEWSGADWTNSTYLSYISLNGGATCGDVFNNICYETYVNNTYVCTTVTTSYLTEEDIVSYAYTSVSEISGLSFSYDLSTIFAVSDSGSIWSVDPTYLTQSSIYTSDATDRTYKDFEGVTTSDTYTFVVSEGAQVIYKLDKESKEVLSYTESINIGKDATSDGFEGIAYIDNGIIILGNQKNPISLTVYDYNENKIYNQYEITELSEVADLEYVNSLEEIWVLDSKKGIIARYKYNSETKEITFNYKYINLADMQNSEKTNVSEEDKTIWGSESKVNPEGLTVNMTTKKLYVSDEFKNAIYVYDISKII